VEVILGMKDEDGKKNGEEGEKRWAG